MAGGVKILTAPSAIIITGCDGKRASIFTPDGKMIHSSADDATVRVTPGIYIVKAAGATVKIIVK